MGEERDDDPQKLKKIAAAAYDYENDSRWADYWSNILIPPNMASRSDVVDHYKRKFYQRYIDSDLVVESRSSSGSSQSAKPSAATSASSTHANDQTRSQKTGPTNRNSGDSATSSPSPSVRWDRQTIQFSVNAWVFIVAVLALIPLVPTNISNRAYRLSLMGSACSSLFSLYTLYGKPRAWKLQALQVYFQPIIVTKDFMYFIYCLMFVTLHLCLKFALIPILCRAIEQVAKILRQNFSHSTLYRKYLEVPCVWVESNTTTLSNLSSHTEVVLGFLLITSLVSWQRNIMQTFMYWQLLRLMYHAPVTAGYHQAVWAKIGTTLNPLINRYAPFLNTAISGAQRWWFR